MKRIITKTRIEDQKKLEIYQEGMIDERLRQLNDEKDFGNLADMDECEIEEDEDGNVFIPKSYEDLYKDKEVFAKI